MGQTRLEKGKWFGNNWTEGLEKLEKIDNTESIGMQKGLEKITIKQIGSERI